MTSKMNHFIQRFGADRQGSPALEFALIAPLFFGTVFGTFELGRGLYERNRIAAAAAIATRTIAMNPSATDSQIETDILAKLDTYDVSDLTITLATETIASQDFKKIEISYDHELLVKFGHRFSGFTLKATRYAAIAPT